MLELPEAQKAHRTALQRSLAQLDRQQQRLLEVFLAEVIERQEFERKRRALNYLQSGLTQQLRELDSRPPSTAGGDATRYRYRNVLSAHPADAGTPIPFFNAGSW